MHVHSTTTYAQNREDVILSGFFDDDEKGFYVDIGANEPTHESVTKYFYDRGWRGINIEPLPTLHTKLEKERPEDINLKIGVGEKKDRATLTYYPHGDGLSTLSERMAEEHKNKPSTFTTVTKKIEVEILPLKDVLAKYAKGKTIHFLKVDVEGFEYEALVGNDWEKFRPEVICIEANHIEKDWRELLKANNYSKVFNDGLNDYYADDRTDRAVKFNYVDAVIFREPIVNYMLAEDFKEYDELVAWLEGNNKSLKYELDATKRQLEEVQNELEQVKTLRKHLKRTSKYFLRRADSKIIKSLSKENKFKPSATSNTRSNHTEDTILKLQDADRDNFERYNKPPSQHPVLPAYLVSKNIARKTAKTILNKDRKN
jgi:FkbM family methyltransferase